MAKKFEIEIITTRSFEKAARKIWPHKTPKRLATEVAENWYSADELKEPLIKLRLGYANVGKRAGARVVLCYFDEYKSAYAVWANKI